MRLSTGIPVPDFSLTDIEGETITPASYAGKRVWIILSRFVACPFCSLRLHEVSKRYQNIADAGVETLVVFPSKEKRVKKFIEKYDPPFRVAADPEQHVFKAFGSETSWAGEMRTAINVPKVMNVLIKMKMNPLGIDDAPHRMPSEYLVGPDGLISQVHYGEELDDGFSIKAVVEWAAAVAA